jgi:predicted dehydrogenase
MGRHHARVLSSLDGVELVAVADPGGDAHGAAGGRRVLDSVADLIATGIDYCAVATPTVHHQEVGLALAEAGVHALIEKPLAGDGPSARKLVEAFAAAGLTGAVGHIERYNPALRSARARLEQGQLGRVYQVATRRQGPFPARVSDVGVVLDLATHDIDLTAWVTQEAFTSVAAHTAHRSGREQEDLVAVVGLLSGGTVTSHLVDWVSPHKERVTTITGERGTFVADTLSVDLAFYGHGSIATTRTASAQYRGAAEGVALRYALATAEPLRVEHTNFRDAVLGKAADIVSLAQGLANVEVAEAIIESATTDRTVHLGATS